MGKFITQDAFAEKYVNLTPYQYGANNPVKYIDYNGDSIVWAQDNASQTMMQQVLTLRANSAIFATIYDRLNNSKAIFNACANDNLVQMTYQNATGGNDPNGKAGGFSENRNIVLSEVYADNNAISEEFFHTYQREDYAQNPRSTQALDAEAKLMNTVIGIETDNTGSSLTGKSKVIDDINKGNSPSLLNNYYGQFILPLTDAAKTGNLMFTPGSSAWNGYKQYLQNFSTLQSQTPGNLYGGQQRALIPAAYNHVIQTTR